MSKVHFGPVWEPREVIQVWAIRSVSKKTLHITLYIKMPSVQCIRQVIAILRILEHYGLPDVHILQEILDLLTEVISLLQEELNGYSDTEESSSEEEEEEQEMD